MNDDFNALWRAASPFSGDPALTGVRCGTIAVAGHIWTQLGDSDYGILVTPLGALVRWVVVTEPCDDQMTRIGVDTGWGLCVMVAAASAVEPEALIGHSARYEGPGLSNSTISVRYNPQPDRSSLTHSRSS